MRLAAVVVAAGAEIVAGVEAETAENAASAIARSVFQCVKAGCLDKASGFFLCDGSTGPDSRFPFRPAPPP